MNRAFTFTMASLVFGLVACNVQNPANAEPVSADSQSESVVLKDPAVWLNGKPFGSVKDLSKLGAEIKSIIEKRFENGDYEEEEVAKPRSNDPIDLSSLVMKNTVYVIIDPSVDLESVFLVYTAIENNGATVRIPRPGALKSSNVDVKPDPFLLSVSIGAKKFDDTVLRMPSSDPKMMLSCPLLITPIEEGNDLTVGRLFGNIEILADGRYMVNDQQLSYKESEGKRVLIGKDQKPVSDKSVLADFEPTRRAVNKANIKTEVAKMFSVPMSNGKIHVMLAVDERAKFASLAPFLEMASDKYFFQVQVIGS